MNSKNKSEYSNVYIYTRPEIFERIRPAEPVALKFMSLKESFDNSSKKKIYQVKYFTNELNFLINLHTIF